jgi:uncharacterized protein (TIGR02646 family)
MRNIQKQTEPKSLTQHRANTNADYDNYAQKKDLRDNLVGEQRGICCYCMQRIRPDPESMKIEHWQCQDQYLHRQLDYNNLLGACLGGQGQEPEKQHCDTKKGNLDLIYNPSDPVRDVESKLQFLGDGTIQSSDANFNQEINTVLNLNQSSLVSNRKAVLTALQAGFMAKNPSYSDIQKELSKWNGDNDGELEPFCQVIVYYLRKKINRMSLKQDR